MLAVSLFGWRPCRLRIDSRIAFPCGAGGGLYPCVPCHAIPSPGIPEIPALAHFAQNPDNFTRQATTMIERTDTEKERS